MEIKEELLDIEGIRKSSKPLIELFIRRTAVLTSTPEHIVDKIIKDQWRVANRQTQPDNEVAEIDFPNLGTFSVSPVKAGKRLVRMKKYHQGLADTVPSTDGKTEKKRLDKMLASQDIIRSIKFKTKQK